MYPILVFVLPFVVQFNKQTPFVKDFIRLFVYNEL